MPADNQHALISPLAKNRKSLMSETKCTPLTPMAMIDFSPGHTPVMINLEKSCEFGESSNPYTLRIRESTHSTPRDHDSSPSLRSLQTKSSEDFSASASDRPRNGSERTQPTQLKPITGPETQTSLPQTPRGAASRSVSRTLLDATSKPRGRNLNVLAQLFPS
jgi:hypothetical protein